MGRRDQIVKLSKQFDAGIRGYILIIGKRIGIVGADGGIRLDRRKEKRGGEKREYEGEFYCFHT